MRVEVAASADEVAAIVAALETVVARANVAPAAAASSSRWRRAGRVYDAYDTAVERGGRA